MPNAVFCLGQHISKKPEHEKLTGHVAVESQALLTPLWPLGDRWEWAFLALRQPTPMIAVCPGGRFFFLLVRPAYDCSSCSPLPRRRLGPFRFCRHFRLASILKPARLRFPPSSPLLSFPSPSTAWLTLFRIVHRVCPSLLPPFRCQPLLDRLLLPRALFIGLYRPTPFPLRILFSVSPSFSFASLLILKSSKLYSVHLDIQLWSSNHLSHTLAHPSSPANASFTLLSLHIIPLVPASLLQPPLPRWTDRPSRRSPSALQPSAFTVDLQPRSVEP